MDQLPGDLRLASYLLYKLKYHNLFGPQFIYVHINVYTIIRGNLGGLI